MPSTKSLSGAPRSHRQRTLTRVLASLSLIFATSISAQAAFDANVTPNTIFGSGNSNGLYTVEQASGVELGLRAKIPFAGVTHSNGDGTYTYSTAELFVANGAGRPWNFEWAVNTDWDGSSGFLVDDLTYLLEMDFDPSAGTDFLAFDPIDPLNHPNGWWDHSFGTNATPNDGGTEVVPGGGDDIAEYAGLMVANNVVQQSWRHAFFPFHPSLTYDPTIAGVYDVALSAFNGASLVAKTTIQVIIVSSTTAIEVYPSDVPDEELPRGNVGDAPAGFGDDSWQGPFSGKSNWHARYLADGDALSALFPADAATLTIADIASISYFTNRPGATPAGRDWWIQLYTRPTGSGDCAGWYKNRFINNYNDHTETGAWTQYSTDGAMTFNKNACGTGAEQTLADLITNHGTELVEMFSIQTDSGWGGFDGYIDGLEITLTNGKVGRANLETKSTTIQIAPWQVPDEDLPRVNPADAPAGFDPDSWQGPAAGKSNWHARYLADGDKLSALFPADVATLTIADLASISYFTKRPGATPATRDWWIQIYTRPTGSGDCAGWYKNRFINNYNDHTETGAWTQYSTDGAMTFNKNGCGTGAEQTLDDLITNHGTELIEMISIQTDSGWGGFDGYIDGLEITLINGNVGRVNLGAACDGELPDLYVDDTGGSDTSNDCRTVGTPCATIQHAVDVSCSGDTINVASGTYAEQVLIKAKNLSLVGAGKATTTIEAPAKASRIDEVADHGFGSRTYDYQVGVFGTGTETVNISGFTLDGLFDAKSSGPGTFRSQQLTFLNASGTIEENSLIDWQDTGAFGAQGVATLVIGSLTAETVVVRDNRISGYQKGGIVAFGTGAVIVSIEDNMVTGAGPITTTAQNGIQISNGAGGSIIGNVSTDANYTPATWCSTGILISLVDDITVRNNVLTGSLCDLLAQTNDSTIEGNQIPAALAYPFSIIGNDNTVDLNVVSGATDFGVYNYGTGNSYTCNRINGNAGGFYFDTLSGPANLVNANSIFGNGVGVDASSLDPNDPAIDATGNWWGCVTGPGGGGCDTVTANVDASLPAVAPPACVNCTANAQCDDGLACTGTETCNLGTNMCEIGTSVVCSDQCETGNCEEPGGTCEPKPVSSPCDTGDDVCTVLDDCDGAGTCTNTGGGGDTDTDTICDLDDNCPVDANTGQEDTDTDGEGDVCDLDDGPAMNLTKVNLKRQRKPSVANGSVRIKGDFVSNPATVLTSSPQITVTVTDEGGFISQYSWDVGSECSLNSRGKLKCQDPERRFKGLFTPFRQTPTVFKLRVTFKKQAIPDTTVFAGDVTVRVTFGPPPPALGSIDRVDTIDCESTGRGYKCRE